MPASLLIALLSAGITVATLRLPERSPAGSPATRELATPTVGARAHGRPSGAKLGPCVLPGPTRLAVPRILAVVVVVVSLERAGHATCTAHGARAPPSLLLVS